MKNKKMKYGLIVFLALVFFAVTDVYSQRRNRNIRSGINRNEFIAEKYLDLSKDQLNQIKDLREKCTDKQAQISDVLKEKRKELGTLIFSDDAKDELIDKVINDIAEIRAYQLKSRIQTQSAIDDIIPRFAHKRLNNRSIIKSRRPIGRSNGFIRNNRDFRMHRNRLLDDTRLHRNRGY